MQGKQKGNGSDDCRSIEHDSVIYRNEKSIEQSEGRSRGMTVRQILKFLSYGTEWRLVGARTGKVLCYCEKCVREITMKGKINNENIS